MGIRPIERTCADCFHFKACHMWSSGAISDTVAPKCPQFEPVRYASLKELQDLYKIHNGEVAPVRYGEWVEEGCQIRCSRCLNPPLYDYFGKIKLSNSCPHCGAKMDGVKKADG